MTVKNISKYHELSIQDLSKIGTRELVNALESSRGKIICSCGKGHHCGDEVLDKKEQFFNLQQDQLYDTLKEILKDREDVSTKIVSKKIEKKKMRY
jgi:uncharacterized FlgJ-related protein